MSSGLADRRKPPFVWVTVASIRAIREGVTVNDPSLSSLRSVYGALIEVANEQRSRPEVGGDSESFMATRERVASYSGTSTKTVSRSLKTLARIGVLRIERREDRQLPSLYVLTELDLPQGTQSPDPGSQSPGDPGSQSPTTTKEETATAKKTASVKTVNRKPVSEAELILTAAVVSQFNNSAGTALSVDAHLTPIVGRIRERPEYGERQHRAIIEAVFASEHWWTGPPTPKIIYGNAAIFEQSIELARAREKKRSEVVNPNAERERVEREFKEAEEDAG